MKVQLVYRNYKPLHDLYASLKSYPPDGVTYLITPPRKFLRYFYPIHLKLGDHPLGKQIISLAQQILFDTGRKNSTMGKDAVDLLHFTQLLPYKIPPQPFVVDFEHILGLANFTKIDSSNGKYILDYLNQSACILPLSQAARKTLTALYSQFGSAIHSQLESKIKVVYPALPHFAAMPTLHPDHHFIPANPDRLNLLFVGNNVYLKGLHELLTAVKVLQGKYKNIRLYIISDASQPLVRRYQSDQIHFFRPRFSRQAIIQQFYLTCDLMVSPTHQDTFGMAILHALACGTPVLTTNQFAIPEMITNDVNGYLMHSKRLLFDIYAFPSREETHAFHNDQTQETALIEQLIEKIEHFYLHREYLERLKNQSARLFEPGGKFSIAARNEKLAHVYKQTLNIST